jgi:uncharacterized protein
MVIVDTGVLVALANANDANHKRAKAVLRDLRDRLITTWPVIVETSHILLTHVGVTAQIRALETYLAGAIALFQLEPPHFPRMFRLMESYAGLPMDLADASLVVLAEHLNDGRILSTDRRDFKTYRWKNRKPFQNLMGEA